MVARIEFDTKEVERALKNLGEKQGPRAVADTITALAFKARKDTLADMDSLLKNPVAFTKSPKGLLVKMASYKDPKIEAEVFFAPAQAQYLGRLQDGGGRSEGDRGVTDAGVLVPTRGSPLSKAGNFPQGPLRWLAKIGGQEDRYKIGRRGQPTQAIWDRGPRGKDFKLVGVFRRRVKYEDNTFPFVRLVTKVVSQNAVKVFAEKFARELKK
jgi:hypothetical protein